MDIHLARHRTASNQDLEAVRRSLETLPRPIVLLQRTSDASSPGQDLPDSIATQFCMEMLNLFDGTLVLLDGDDGVPRPHDARIRSLADLGREAAPDRLPAILAEVDLVVAVASEPVSLCGLTGTPSVRLWLPGYPPQRSAPPAVGQLNVVLSDHMRPWHRRRRVGWNIVEHPGSAFDPVRLAAFCAAMLRPPRYLREGCQPADVQLQQWILDWCRNDRGNWLSPHVDRHRSLDVLFRQLRNRFRRPTIIETGCIRAEEEWAASGNFTYLAGAYLLRAGGVLHTVDIDASHCRFARRQCVPFGTAVEVHQGDSVEFLRNYAGPLDALYLDSLDACQPGHAEHALAETQAALPRLSDLSIVAYDDTPSDAGVFRGKGALAVPWLLARGFHVLYAGYQVVLSRSVDGG